MMRALSIRQPWVELILRGEKTEEYRPRPTNIRERVYLYAGLGIYNASARAEILEEVGFDFEDLTRGLILGTVEIVDCIEYGSRDYGWVLAKPKRLKVFLKPICQPQPAWFYPFGNPNI